jgi:hypothetical protein
MNVGIGDGALRFYTGCDEWEVVESDGRFAVCRFSNERMRITDKAVLFGATLRTPENALEAHWFSTREWAGDFCRLCNRLDQIARDMLTPITYTTTSTQQIGFVTPSQPDDWQCYLFGNRPGGAGMVYQPSKGRVPNLFVRWMMRVCFDCLWVKGKNT